MSDSSPPPNSSDEEGEVSFSGVAWSALTDMGKVRKNNEDAFIALEMDAHEVRFLGKTGSDSFESGDFIFAVSDGMGGHNAGEFASRIAVDKITQLLPSAFRLGAQGLNRGGPDLLEEVFHAIHEEIQQLGQAYQELEGMGATLSLCWFGPEVMTFCHIGDSRIYYLPRESGIKQVSEDHTHVAYLVKTGKLHPSQARYHPSRNRLNQALTSRASHIEPHLGTVRYELGDRFMICSDGLTDGLSENGIDTMIRKPPEKYADHSPAETLVRESIVWAGRDNTTAVVVEVV